jgi:hypothetical protein
VDTAFLVNLTSPPLLFFFLGIAAVALRSDLEIPAQVAKFLSLYLLFAIGFKGGVALAENAAGIFSLVVLGATVFLACIIPVCIFFLLRNRIPVADAAAIAATYGSVSVVTFVPEFHGVVTWSPQWPSRSHLPSLSLFCFITCIQISRTRIQCGSTGANSSGRHVLTGRFS